MFAVPVLWCTAEWVARCQYKDYLVYDAATFDVSGVLVCESGEGIRFVPTSRSLSYDEADDYNDEVYVGPGPWIELYPYGWSPSLKMCPETLESRRFAPQFLGRCYRVHNAVRILQTRFRRIRTAAAFRQAARKGLAFDEAVIAKILSFL